MSEWNPLRWLCGHGCLYCPEFARAKNKASSVPHLRPHWRKLPAPRKDAVCVCIDTDLFHPRVPDALIREILAEARRVHDTDDTIFIFGTKNPGRILDYLGEMPRDSYYLVTVESDIDHHMSQAPPALERLGAFSKLSGLSMNTVLAIQPIMRFTERFADLIIATNPGQVAIGSEQFGLPFFPTPPFREARTLAKKLKAAGVSHVGINGHEGLNFTRWPAYVKPVDYRYFDEEWIRRRWAGYKNIDKPGS